MVQVSTAALEPASIAASSAVGRLTNYLHNYMNVFCFNNLTKTQVANMQIKRHEKNLVQIQMKVFL